jgi:hypothetical protein
MCIGHKKSDVMAHLNKTRRERMGGEVVPATGFSYEIAGTKLEKEEEKEKIKEKMEAPYAVLVAYWKQVQNDFGLSPREESVAMDIKTTIFMAGYTLEKDNFSS